MIETKKMQETECLTGEAFITSFLKTCCRKHEDVVAERVRSFCSRHYADMFANVGHGAFALAAGERPKSEKKVKSPDEEVRFVFASSPNELEDLAWRAELVVPPNASAETKLSLRVTSAKGQPIKGMFMISGMVLPLNDGKANILFGTFLAGIKDTKVAWRDSENSAWVYGSLLFF